jgi:hypothetical protein
MTCHIYRLMGTQIIIADELFYAYWSCTLIGYRDIHKIDFPMKSKNKTKRNISSLPKKRDMANTYLTKLTSLSSGLYQTYIKSKVDVMIFRKGSTCYA